MAEIPDGFSLVYTDQQVAVTTVITSKANIGDDEYEIVETQTHDGIAGNTVRSYEVSHGGKRVGTFKDSDEVLAHFIKRYKATRR